MIENGQVAYGFDVEVAGDFEAVRGRVVEALGVITILLYLHLFFAPYRRLRQGVGSGDLVKAGHALTQIRRLVAINMGLGLITIFVALVGAN